MKSSSQAIKQHARELLKELWGARLAGRGKPNVDEFFPIDADAVVRHIGWRLEEVTVAAYSLDPRESIQGYCDQSTKTIFLSTDKIRTPGQRRFTIAHEIGHARLHEGSPHRHYRKFPPPSKTREKSPPSLPQEVAANVFAAELLMPGRTVRRRFKDRFGVDELWIGSAPAKKIAALGAFDTPQLHPVAVAVANHTPQGERSLAAYFGVSPDAMGFRLETLRLVHL